jgi:uncharacterized protein YdeI (YjbR/CyaY-like superfamily)
MEPTFFATPEDLRRWFAENHATAAELWVGFYTVGSGKPSITWPQSVDEALCVGWIDGVRKGIDETSYKIRFTPRRQGSIWSKVNIERCGVLIAEGRMQSAGLKAFGARREDRSRIYSFEQGEVHFSEELQKVFEAEPEAWEYFQSQSPAYRKQHIWRVMSRKREETRRKLRQLIEACAKKQRLA